MTVLMPAGGFDLDVNARRQAEFVKRFDRLGRSLHDVDQTLVRTDLELLPGLFVDMRARQNGITLDACRQGNRSVNDRPSTLRRIDDFHRTLIQDGVIVRFHADPDDFGSMSGQGMTSGETRFSACQSAKRTPTFRQGNNGRFSGNH